MHEHWKKNLHTLARELLAALDIHEVSPTDKHADAVTELVDVIEFATYGGTSWHGGSPWHDAEPTLDELPDGTVLMTDDDELPSNVFVKSADNGWDGMEWFQPLSDMPCTGPKAAFRVIHRP